MCSKAGTVSAGPLPDTLLGTFPDQPYVALKSITKYMEEIVAERIFATNTSNDGRNMKESTVFATAMEIFIHAKRHTKVLVIIEVGMKW